MCPGRTDSRWRRSAWRASSKLSMPKAPCRTERLTKKGRDIARYRELIRFGDSDGDNPPRTSSGERQASLCYIIYNSLFWPGISTAITTCSLTALTTIGTSHQKQILRFGGALVGGVVIGMGAQVCILPYIDSIGAFTVLFASVIGAAAWFATSCPRLSYFGVQIAVAFCLINLQEFKIQTSLAVARDRVAGILLGLLMIGWHSMGSGVLRLVSR